MSTLDSVTLPTLLPDAAPEMHSDAPADEGILDGDDGYDDFDSGTENERHNEVDGGETAAAAARYQREIADLEKKWGPNWYDRINGLQGSVQQATERARAEEQKRIELENRLFEQEIRDLPEPQKREAWQQLDEARAAEAERAEVMTQRQLMNEMARQFITDKLSQKYGVPVAQLQQFNDPQSMEAYAAGVAEVRRETTKQKRKQQRSESGADRFEGGGSPAPAQKKQYNGDLRAAANDFASAALSKLR